MGNPVVLVKAVWFAAFTKYPVLFLLSAGFTALCVFVDAARLLDRIAFGEVFVRSLIGDSKKKWARELVTERVGERARECAVHCYHWRSICLS